MEDSAKELILVSDPVYVHVLLRLVIAGRAELLHVTRSVAVADVAPHALRLSSFFLFRQLCSPNKIDIGSRRRYLIGKTRRADGEADLVEPLC